jgi:hypothetical protein
LDKQKIPGNFVTRVLGEEMEKTLVVLKPSLLDTKGIAVYLENILNIFGSFTATSKVIKPEELRLVYRYMTKKAFYGDMERLYSSRVSTIYIVEGVDIINRISHIVKGGLRPIFRNENVSYDNIFHCSDTYEDFIRERDILLNDKEFQCHY